MDGTMAAFVVLIFGYMVDTVLGLKAFWQLASLASMFDMDGVRFRFP